LDEFWIKSEAIGKIEYHWPHLIIVSWHNVTDRVAYWTEVCLFEDAIGENKHGKLAGFAQHILCTTL